MRLLTLLFNGRRRRDGSVKHRRAEFIMLKTSLLSQLDLGRWER